MVGTDASSVGPHQQSIGTDATSVGTDRATEGLCGGMVQADGGSDGADPRMHGDAACGSDHHPAPPPAVSVSTASFRDSARAVAHRSASGGREAPHGYSLDLTSPVRG